MVDNPLIEKIRNRQKDIMKNPIQSEPLKPDTLLLACIDARKDLNEVGFSEESTETLRNIAATVVKYGEKGSDKMEQAFADSIAKGVKDIVIMGHTSCGGMEACLCGKDVGLPAVAEHLTQYHGIRAGLIAEHGDPNALADVTSVGNQMSEQGVRLSYEHLMEYPSVRAAIEAEKVKIHGLVIHTGSATIKELDPVTGEFKPMAAPTSTQKPECTLDIVRDRQRMLLKYIDNPESIPAPPHNPQMLIVGDKSPPINAKTLQIPYGSSLIYREWDPTSADMSKAMEGALQFAIQAKKVKDVTLMLNTGENPKVDDREQKEEELRAGYDKLRQNPAVAAALADEVNPIKLHALLLDVRTKRISEMDPKTREFRSMASLQHNESWGDRSEQGTQRVAGLS